MPPSPRPRGAFARRRALLAVAGATLLSACAGGVSRQTQGDRVIPPDGAFAMPDGALLPYRAWLPAGRATAVMLALHGFNDSRDAWEIPGPVFAEAGIAVYGPDQRGFGGAPGRGGWAGIDTMTSDAAVMAGVLAARHPGVPLVLLGESMGGAVLMCLATSTLAPPGARYVMVAPAVWGRAAMNIFLRGSLWLASTVLPGLAVSGSPVRVWASDNHQAIYRLSRDPLTIHDTRFGTLRGLVDMMDAALAAAAVFRAPGLFLYGGHDELVPKEATAEAWHALPQGGARRAFYPPCYHLMLRDHERAAPLGDIVAWTHAPDAPLPSHAERAAAAFLATRA